MCLYTDNGATRTTLSSRIIISGGQIWRMRDSKESQVRRTQIIGRYPVQMMRHLVDWWDLPWKITSLSLTIFTILSGVLQMPFIPFVLVSFVSKKRESSLNSPAIWVAQITSNELTQILIGKNETIIKCLKTVHQIAINVAHAQQRSCAQAVYDCALNTLMDARNNSIGGRNLLLGSINHSFLLPTCYFLLSTSSPLLLLLSLLLRLSLS